MLCNRLRCCVAVLLFSLWLKWQHWWGNREHFVGRLQLAMWGKEAAKQQKMMEWDSI